MKINWSDIPDEQFEEITAALMSAMGFENVTVRTGGSDEGWDIDAQLAQRLPDGRLQVESWRVECKRYQKNPPAEKIRDHYVRMTKTSEVPDHVLFVTTSAFTNPTKHDLEEFAQQDRVRITFWERQKLTRLIEKHMGDAPLRTLIAPYVELTLPMDVLRESCTYQVIMEIQRRVGRKYLPELCRPRPIEKDIQRFIAANLETAQMRELGALLRQVRLPDLEPAAAEIWANALQAISGARDWREAEPHLRRILELADEKLRDAIRQLVEGVRCLKRNCLFIKDKAGSGKTNLLCRLATHSEEPQTLTMFFSCKFDLPASRSLEDIIIKALYVALEQQRGTGGHKFAMPMDSPDLLEGMMLTLQKNRAQLVIFLDGINENRDLAALDEAIINLLSHWNALPIKFVITCRDIFWGFFSEEQWSRFFFEMKIHELPGFAEGEIDEIIAAYFRSFAIKGKLIGAGREKCRHPLLLRFFCEAYSGQNIREYGDLRLKDLFEVYWLRKRQEIAEALSLGTDGGRRVEEFLFNLLSYMSDRYATQIPLSQIPQLTGEQDLESDHSLYKHLLDQDIILEEMPPDDAFDRTYYARRISFVYDEFYDYMMALHHVRTKGWDTWDDKEICLDFIRLIRQSIAFEQLHGVAEYLVLISERKGLHRILCAALARLGNYEILCNVLPKLKGEMDWAIEVLGLCLSSVPTSSVAVKHATGWLPPHEVLENLLLDTSPDDIYPALLGEVRH